jgi:hypothetical protein
LDEPYAYYIDLSAKVEQMEHLVALNWVYVWMEVRRKSWEMLYCFEYERDYGVLRADALAIIKNAATGALRVLFVELDRGGNGFDKVKRYNDLYESEKYANEWWAPKATRFPAVILATTNHKRERRIQEVINRDNRNGLEFIVKHVDYFKNEVIE